LIFGLVLPAVFAVDLAATAVPFGACFVGRLEAFVVAILWARPLPEGAARVSGSSIVVAKYCLSKSRTSLSKARSSYASTGQL
jgi:hypothetical protein